MVYSAYDEERHQNRLKELAAVLAQLDVEGLVRSQFKPVNFEDGRPLFELIKTFYAELSTSDLKFLPYPTAQTLCGKTESLIKAIQTVKETQLHSGISARDESLNRLYAQWHDAFQQTHSAFALSKLLTKQPEPQAESLKQLQANINAAQVQISKAVSDVESVVSKQNAFVSDLEGAIAAARDAITKKSVAVEAGHFETECSEQSWKAGWWLLATALLGGAILLTIKLYFINGWKDVKPSDVATVLHNAIPRVLVLSVLYTALVWAMRNFSAHRHNYTVNKHRQNALNVFEAFARGAHDQQTKDAILRQAVACVFAPQPTGFIREDGAGAEGSKVVEIIQSAASKDTT